MTIIRYITLCFIFLMTTAHGASMDSLQSATDYLSDACSDGKERIGIYTPEDATFHDISIDPQEYDVSYDRDTVLELCEKKELHVYHCHTKADNPIHQFPGSTFGGNTSDFAFAIDIEYLCANISGENSVQPPHIEHYLIQTGGNNKIVEYGLSSKFRTFIHEAGLESGAAINNFTDALLSSRPTISMADINARNTEINAGIILLTKQVDGSYTNSFAKFLLAVCGEDSIKTGVLCDNFSVESFADTLSENDAYFITPHTAFGASIKTIQSDDTISTVAIPKNIDLTSYPKYQRITPWIYDAFIENYENVIVVNCGEGSYKGEADCSRRLNFVSEVNKKCEKLKVGIANTALYPELRERDMLDNEMFPPDFKMFKNGRRMITKNHSNESAVFYGNILCDFNIELPIQPLSLISK